MVQSKFNIDYSFYMKKIILIIMLFINKLLVLNCYAEETIWNIKDNDFWIELEENELKFEQEKSKKLDMIIELNLDSKIEEISLIEAITHGLENSTSYKIAKYKSQYSKWEYANKLCEFLPNINYAFSLTDLKGEFLVGGILPRKVHETVYSSSFSTEWEFFNAKRVFDSIKFKNQKKAQKHTENFSRDELIYRISTAYYELLQKKFKIEIYKYNLVEVEEQLKYNQSLYNIGDGTRFDILRAEAEVEKAKAEIEKAILELKMAQTNLANLAGYPIFSNLIPKDKIIHKLDLIDNDLSIETLYQQALNLREDIKSKENMIRALKMQKYSNASDFIPSVSFIWERAYVGTTTSGGRSNDTYGILISAPLGRNLGAYSFSKYKMDNINFLIAEKELNKLKSDIEKNIIDNYYTTKSNSEIIIAKNKQTISTKEGLRQALGRMRIGQATYLDVIDANQQKTLARIELIDSIVAYNKSQLKQMFETGTLNLFEIKTKYEISKSLFNY